MEYKAVKKGFTIIEAVIAIFIIITALSVVALFYVNFINAFVLKQSYQLALDNIRLGTSKIFNEIKLGVNFNVVSNVLEFKDKNCNLIKLYKNNDNLILETGDKAMPLFDNSLLILRSFNVYTDQPSGDPNFYSGISKKIIILGYDFDVKTNKGLINVKFTQSVAPLNSTLPYNPCI